MSPAQSRSQKIKVVEYLYERLRLEGRTVATLSDVKEAIEHCNTQFGLGLSASNPANFMKDLVRGRNAGANWPESLKAQRVGGRQRVGEGRALEFVPYKPGQTEPFENSFSRNENLIPTPVQSISLPLAAKSLGRKDENWLIQVAVALRLVEQHLATRTREPPLSIVEVTHLQTGVKLATSEVDALYLAVAERESERLNVLVTCEAKQDGERILEHQIVGQVVAAHKSIKSLELGIALILPIAIQAVANPEGSVYLAEFEEWTPKMAEADETAQGELALVAERLYQLTPAVRGIGFVHRRGPGRSNPDAD